MFMKLLMSTKGQFKMYLEPEMIERLNDAALRFNRGSKQLVVAEIVSLYLPTWVAINTSMTRAIELQVQKMIEESARSVNRNPDAIGMKSIASEETTVRTRKAGTGNGQSERSISKIRKSGKRRSK